MSFRGIEALATSHPSTQIPTSKIALSLLVGFTFMFLVEQFTSHSDHSHSPSLPSVNSPHINFDVDLGELEREQGLGHAGQIRTSDASNLDHTVKMDGESRRPRAYPLTLGLVIHSLADGLALGVSALSRTESDLSFVVFLALMIHKGAFKSHPHILFANIIM
jgi:zinc transporter 9